MREGNRFGSCWELVDDVGCWGEPRGISWEFCATAWAWGMNRCGETIRLRGDSWLRLHFWPSQQLGSLWKETVSQEAGLWCSFRAALQKIRDQLSGALPAGSRQLPGVAKEGPGWQRG